MTPAPVQLAEDKMTRMARGVVEETDRMFQDKGGFMVRFSELEHDLLSRLMPDFPPLQGPKLDYVLMGRERWAEVSPKLHQALDQ